MDLSLLKKAEFQVAAAVATLVVGIGAYYVGIGASYAVNHYKYNEALSDLAAHSAAKSAICSTEMTRSAGMRELCESQRKLTRVYMEAVVDSADPLNISSEELRIDVTKAVVRIKT